MPKVSAWQIESGVAFFGDSGRRRRGVRRRVRRRGGCGGVKKDWSSSPSSSYSYSSCRRGVPHPFLFIVVVVVVFSFVFGLCSGTFVVGGGGGGVVVAGRKGVGGDATPITSAQRTTTSTTTGKRRRRRQDRLRRGDRSAFVTAPSLDIRGRERRRPTSSSSSRRPNWDDVENHDKNRNNKKRDTDADGGGGSSRRSFLRRTSSAATSSVAAAAATAFSAARLEVARAEDVVPLAEPRRVNDYSRLLECAAGTGTDTDHATTNATLRTVSTTTTQTSYSSSSSSSISVASSSDDDRRGDVIIKVYGPNERVGLELYDVEIGVKGGGNERNVVAIKRIAYATSSNRDLRPGMILVSAASGNNGNGDGGDAISAAEVQRRLRDGPYPVELKFRDLASSNVGGDAISDTGTPIVSARDALNAAKSSSTTTSSSSPSLDGRYVIRKLDEQPATCNIKSRRNDVLEIVYDAYYAVAGKDDGDGGNAKWIPYDSSSSRGTGSPYLMVLGSGDMMGGVDLGLYEMCPGERRSITIPSGMGYGRRGNRLFRVPPDATLRWDVELISINTVVRKGYDATMTREEMEGRE